MIIQEIFSCLLLNPKAVIKLLIFTLNKSKHDIYINLSLGVFADNKYYDVTAEYAKRSAEEVLGVITITNRSNEDAQITVLPTLW